MKNKWYIAIGFICGVLGLSAILIGSFHDNFAFKMSGVSVILLEIAGFCMVGISLFCMVVIINRWAKEDEERVIEEEDERNIMIRGKAAENTIVITSFVMLFVELLFICMKETIPALILGIAVVLCVSIDMWMISYYQKKY